jgi:hypothetical protein
MFDNKIDAPPSLHLGRTQSRRCQPRNYVSWHHVGRALHTTDLLVTLYGRLIKEIFNIAVDVHTYSNT